VRDESILIGRTTWWASVSAPTLIVDMEIDDRPLPDFLLNKE